MPRERAKKPELYKSFVIGRAFRDGHLGTMAGQIPRRDMDIDRRALDRLVSQRPPPWSADRMLARPVFTTRGAMRDLGLDAAVETEWGQFLHKAIYHSEREFQMRQQVMERLTREDWPPELRKTVFQRALSLYRNSMEKALVVLSPDELAKAQKAPKTKLTIPRDKGAEAEAEAKKKAQRGSKPPAKDAKPTPKDAKPTPKGAKKEDTRAAKKPDKIEKLKEKPKSAAPKAGPKAGPGSKTEQKPAAKQSKDLDPRGGTFHRRVPHESGKGFRYYYDPEKYNARKDAHVSGEDSQRQAMGKAITKMLDKAGENGCAPKDMGELAKKYGTKEMAGHFKKECGEGGGTMFANGRFYRRRGSSSDKG